MTEEERLKYIQEELGAIINEITPHLNELIFIRDCLENLVVVSCKDSVNIENTGQNPHR